MNVILAVAGLRLIALVAIVSVVWPDLQKLWRKARGSVVAAETKEVMP
jgi:hypothetical protein